ncbi:hypothetical protein [Fluviicola sp.]|uniref:hypothetical protein n=1 Tax=Fluviicola sp. TaxID=1917219 RepID=UPI0031E3BE2A
MSANQKESRVPLLLYPILIALVILYIVFTILTFGIFLPEGDKKKSGSKMTKNNSEEERIRIVLERKQNRLKTLVLRIAELEVIKRQITRKEKRILFGVRLIICIGLISFNWFYLNEIIQKSLNMKHIDQIIGSIADLNAIILLGYSLPAYLLYGTVGKFTSAMKRKITFILTKKHIPSLSELQLLKSEEMQLRQDIHQLKLALEGFH